MVKSARLTSSAVCIVAGEHGFDRTLEKYLARQQGHGMISAPVLEVNPSHPLIVTLAMRRESAKAGVVDAASAVPPTPPES